MTLQEFIAKYTGKAVDFDGKYKNQCVDLYRQYVKDVWNLPKTPGVVGAYQIMNSLPRGFDTFTSGIPQAGDVIIWNQNLIKNGHVAITVSANASRVTVFQQNAPRAYDPANIAIYTYKNVMGWFRPHLLITTHMQLVNDKGTVYLITGNTDKRKIGIADLASLGLFGDEPQMPMDTSGIPQHNTIKDGKTITNK